MRRSAVVLVALVAPMAQAIGQAAVAPAGRWTRADLNNLFHTGQRVRLVMDSRLVKNRVVGFITGRSADTVVVDTGETWRSRLLFNPAPPVVDEFRQASIDLTQVDSVDVSLGRSRWYGVLVKGSKAIAFGMAAMAVVNLQGQGAPRPFRVLQGATTGAVLGGMIGIPFGFFRGEERWRRVSSDDVIAAVNSAPASDVAGASH